MQYTIQPLLLQQKLKQLQLKKIFHNVYFIRFSIQYVNIMGIIKPNTKDLPRGDKLHHNNGYAYTPI